MLSNTDQSTEYTAIYLPVNRFPELIIATLDSIFYNTDIKLSDVVFINLNSELLMAVNKTYKNFTDNVNTLATSLYRHYLYLSSITSVIHGPALLFNYVIDDIQNIETIKSINNSYIEEVFLRASNEKTIL